jgi:hypothetical protein
MEGHVKALGIIYLVFGALGLLAALAFLLFFGGLAGVATTQGGEEGAVGGLALGAIGGFLFVVIGVMSLPSILAGWGLLNFKEWARILAIVLSALNLFGFPIGTILGAYGLWVLLNQQTAPLFQKR